MVKKLDKRRAKRVPLAGALRLFSTPLALLGGVWVVLLLVAAISATSILHPGNVSQPQPLPAPASTSIAYIGEETSDPPPLWLWGAIALGGVAGSVLISLSFRRQTLSRPRRKRVGASLKRGSAAAVRQQRPRPPQKRSPQRSARQKPPVPTKAAFAAKPVRSAMPPESRQPRTRGKHSLSRQLDMRKRQSLASLLRNRY